MICIIYKILVLLKITRVLKRFLGSVIDLHFSKKNFFFSQHIMMENTRSEE